MYTEITLANGSKVTHVTQQYEIGTYLIINNDPRLQGSVRAKEPQYHINLRKKVLRDNEAKLTAGSTIDYKGKEPINEFYKENAKGQDL